MIRQQGRYRSGPYDPLHPDVLSCADKLPDQTYVRRVDEKEGCRITLTPGAIVLRQSKYDRVFVPASDPVDIELRRIDDWQKIPAVLGQHRPVAA